MTNNPSSQTEGLGVEQRLQCHIGSCVRHQRCMYEPCRNAAHKREQARLTTPAPIKATGEVETAIRAEERYAENHPELAAVIDRALALYRFDTQTDRYRAHEVGRIVANNVALTIQTASGRPTYVPVEGDKARALLSAVDAWIADPSADAEQAIMDARAALSQTGEMGG